MAAKAQTKPTAARRLFFTVRRTMEMLRPEARVTGAAPAKPLSARASAKLAVVTAVPGWPWCVARSRLGPRGRGPRSRGASSPVGGQRGMHVSVGAQDVGQRLRVEVIRLLPKYRVPLAIAGHSHRVDGINPSTCLTYRGDHQDAACFDGHRDRGLRIIAGLSQHGDQLAKPCALSRIRRLATRLPSTSTSATSCWPSAQSIPQYTRGRVSICQSPFSRLFVLFTGSLDPGKTARRPNDEARWPSLRLSRSRSQRSARIRSSQQSSGARNW